MNVLVEQLKKLQEKKYHKWNETFEDEDTHEMVTVERADLLTTETSDEEMLLWQKIVAVISQLSDEELKMLHHDILKTTMIDANPLLEELAHRGDIDALSELGYIEKLQELSDKGNKYAAKELYLKYYCGDEEHGIFIDKVRAKEYFDLAGDAILEEWDPSDDPGTEYPEEFEYTITGNPQTLQGISIFINELCQRVGTPNNELGLYIPLRIVMKVLVGSDTEYYRGNILHMEQKSPECLVLNSEADNGYPLLYALRQCFPDINIEMEQRDW